MDCEKKRSVKKNIVELTNCSVQEYRAMGKLPVKVVADNVRSMYNVGAVFRTSDAFLIDEFILCGITPAPPHPEIAKTALGAEESVAWRKEGDTVETVTRLKQEGWQILVLEQTHNSIPLQDFEATPDARYALVIGNEVDGVDERVVALADRVLEIPQHGVKHSLNVSSSASIALWELYKRML